MKEDENNNNCAIDKINLPLKICQTSCNICNSNCLKEIHLLKENGAKFLEIVKICEEKYNFKTTDSSLCRHFQNYNKIRTNVTAQILDKDLVDDAMKRAVHCSAVIGLIDQYLILLKKRLDDGLIANISDFEKLMNIRYKLLTGSDDEEKNLTVVFENAINKYKVEIAQPRLFNPDEPPVVEKTPERKEEDLVREA